ncbi:hypothetical protein [Tamaricihabitans halophyticus]|nr:hypothetical protein [Tamaricihabitans halophyticus]
MTSTRPLLLGRDRFKIGGALSGNQLHVKRIDRLLGAQLDLLFDAGKR